MVKVSVVIGVMVSVRDKIWVLFRFELRDIIRVRVRL